jgi:two-component system, chemotaxis family, CheB/CheR fusion protein
MPRKTRGGVDTKLGALQKPENGSSSQKRRLRIVGIGASAGGLEAIEQFFTSMPPDSGIAFVIVQHLDPAGHSSMPEILARFTKMPVQVASDGLKMEPNSIYLIPAGKSMGILGGKLTLEEPAQPAGLRLPIDFLLRSLAKEQGEDAIAIILSGTGTDGTLGLRAIKEEQGTVFVQEPASARYNGMPISAINTGFADFVLKPDQMPKILLEFLNNSVVKGAMSATETEEPTKALRQIFAILSTRTGHDFSHYKVPTVRRRLQRRMSFNQIKDLAGYARFLKGNEEEVKALIKDLLISVTNFFRDPKAFEVLKKQVKKSLKNKTEGSDVRVWVSGCSTGEEAYSLAIIINECLSELEKRLSVQVYGTDIDLDALRLARAGQYPANIAADVSPERLKRFFAKDDGTYTVNKEIRESVVFAPQNFIKDPPFSRMDLISCRNLLIYLDSDIQKRMMPLLHYALRPGGILFLGTSETVDGASDLFHVLDRKWKIFQRREVAVGADRLKFPTLYKAHSPVSIDEPAREMIVTGIPEIADNVFHDNYAPTFAVVDDKYRPVYVRGRTGNYLEIVSGQPTWNILEMAREGLRSDLTSAIYRAASEKKVIVHEGVRVKHNGGFQFLTLTVAPFTGPGIPPGFLIIVFQENGTAEEASAKPSLRGGKRVAGLEEELRLTRENLQATIEELEATNEELKSANEELQSNNEELQSTNEELDTSREELQSLNEELTTLNAELQDKNELVGKANDDLNNFVNRTDIAILLLDNELNITRYTPATSAIFNVRQIDIGRPLTEINSKLVRDNQMEDINQVLRTMQPKEIEVHRDDGHWYNMRISPYLTAQNNVRGLVISLLDIDKQKQAAESLRKTSDYLDNLFNYANAPIMVWDPELKITRFNHAFERLTGRSADEMSGKQVDTLIPPDERREALEKINRITTKGERLEAVEIPIQHVDGSIRMVLWNSATVFDADGKTPVTTIAQGQDITERKQAEEKILQQLNMLEQANIMVMDEESKIVFWNKGAEEMYGYSQQEALGRTPNELLKTVFPKPLREIKQELVQNGKWKGELTHTRRDGVKLISSSVWTTFQAKKDHPVQIIEANTDISELKKAEQDLQQTRDYLDNLLNYANAPIVVWNPDLEITRFNRAFERLTGRDAREILGKKLEILFPNDSRQASMVLIKKTKQGERWEVVEIPIQHVDGSISTVLWNSATLLDADGKTPVATIAQGQDITERKKAEEDLNKYTADLELANKELESFSYSVSHDLRAPLRGIDGFSEALAEDYKDKLDKEGQGYIDHIRSSAQLMSQLIDDMLKLSRVSRAEMKPVNVNLSDIVRSISEELKRSQPDRNAEFLISQDINAVGDKPLLDALMRNLLENSWKFTRKNQRTLIEFGLIHKDGVPVYYVKDNGIGFDMAYADKLFKPFSRLHNQKDYSGSGIGLANVYRIIRRHNGRIWAESVPYKGATFYFTLNERGK